MSRNVFILLDKSADHACSINLRHVSHIISTESGSLIVFRSGRQHEVAETVDEIRDKIRQVSRIVAEQN